MKYYKAILLLLLLFGINMVNIKDVQAYENIMFSSLTIENGLPQSTVETMIQDSKGFIWVGTNDGLARYNGYEFKIYRNEYGKKESLVGNYIVKIVEDRYGYIWVGTSSGVSRINTSDNKILNYTEDNGLEDKNVTGLVLTSDGDVVVATYKGGLYKYDYQKDKFNKINLKNHKNISSIAKDNKGYKNLIKLVSTAWCEGFYYKPRINFELLEQYHEGLIRWYMIFAMMFGICLIQIVESILHKILKMGKKGTK